MHAKSLQLCSTLCNPMDRYTLSCVKWASLVAQTVKSLPAIPGFSPWVRKILWRREWLPTPVLLPGKSHGQRSLEGYRPWGRKESDTTEWSACGGLERCFLGATHTHTHTHTHTLCGKCSWAQSSWHALGKQRGGGGPNRCPEGLSWFLRG